MPKENSDGCSPFLHDIVQCLDYVVTERPAVGASAPAGFLTLYRMVTNYARELKDAYCI